MPLNRLENFIKNIEGRILYVNPNDLDSTDSISNDGNSLAQPFKTIQRALIESARFSYVTGKDNDIIEKTTILVYPGEHLIDNRPGFAIKPSSGNPSSVATAVAPNGHETTPAANIFSLSLTSNFDLTQRDNILYKFNSVEGGVVVPRGTSIVGLDLRKTKIRPKYVPNPTDPAVPTASIFRITGSSYFWQFSIFDGDLKGKVYTNHENFGSEQDSSYESTPSFSHNKLTVFEYADGVNNYGSYSNTDLDMYYYKLSNAFIENAATKVIPSGDRFPVSKDSFAKRRPEYEIVGAFASDPINISAIKSGTGTDPSPIITVTTSKPHGLNAGTPIKISGVTYLNSDLISYNTSSTVQVTLNDTQFTYLATGSFIGLPGQSGGGTGLSVDNATVTVETDTVDGASPYIFNCSLRSVYGMNGMNADGSKATGFRSMVVAQFTGISLQKDDRSFAKYNPINRTYNSIKLNEIVYGDALSSQSSSVASDEIYHLDSGAIYRKGWETAHIKITNDAILQIVSVFAIGYNRHFSAESGGDASITNSNSNFGQLSLTSDGFKKEAFDKDNTAYITSIVTPKSIVSSPIDIDWLEIDGTKTTTVGVSSHLYLAKRTNESDKPATLIAGYRIGANLEDKLYVPIGSDPSTQSVYSATIQMTDSASGSVSSGTNVSVKRYGVTNGPDALTNTKLTIGSHGLQTGEKIRIFSDIADLPENILENTIYYAITSSTDSSLSSTQIKIASSKRDADSQEAIKIYGGQNLYIESRVHDKESGDKGSPIQWDSSQSQWYVHVDPNNTVYTNLTGITTSNTSYVQRKEDPRSLDDKIYKLRIVVPKEVTNGKNPEESFIIQESSSTGARSNADFTRSGITTSDYDFNRNLRIIGLCTYSSPNQTITVTTELPHDLNVGDHVNIKNVVSAGNTSAEPNIEFNGTFAVSALGSAINGTDSKAFRYKNIDVDGATHDIDSSAPFSTNDVNNRTTSLPRFEKNDIRENYYVYRNDTISEYIENQQDGIYQLYTLNAGNNVPTEFTDLKYSQNVSDLYPQLDRDNPNDNPPASTSSAKRSPLGDVATNYLKNSLTRESVDKLLKTFGKGLEIINVGTGSSSFTLTFDREHNYGSVIDGTVTAGSGYSPSSGITTYQNVKLLYGNSNPSIGEWRGATAQVTVNNASIETNTLKIIDGGSAYTAGDLFFDQSVVGAGAGGKLTITDNTISQSINDVIQVTGIGTVSDGYYKLNSIPSKTQISIAKTSGDHVPIIGQYIFNTGPSVKISTTGYDSTTQITTFGTSTAHGLTVGTKFRVLDNADPVGNNLGDFIVEKIIDVTTFTAKTGMLGILNGYILRLGLTSNDGVSDSTNENLASRTITFYDKERLILSTLLSSSGSSTSLEVALSGSGTGIVSRFPLGSYIQIDDEIMRITSSTLSGSGNNKITVIRGSLGTITQEHLANSVIKKIKPIPIEFRRPSILRASGHTFEYVGYGPGNYSTGLPQVQVKSLTEREEFLSQSQERSCGAVVYTGMNNRGDFFIGNKRVSSATGQERTFDAPIPTVTGEDPSRLSVIFDEVICKERIIVEGGKSSEILSQFDGPVTFNGNLKFNKGFTMNGDAKFTGGTTFTEDIVFQKNVTLTGGNLKLKDNKKLLLGDEGDTELYHNQNNTVIDHKKTGNLKLQDGGTDRIEVNASGLVLSGITTTGIVTASDQITAGAGVYLPVTKEITLGDPTTGIGLTIKKDTTNSVISHYSNVASGLYLSSNKKVEITDISSPLNVGLRFNNSGKHEVELFYDSTASSTPPGSSHPRLKTTADGIDVGATVATGNINAYGDITAYAGSDRRLKDNITPIPDALDKVMSISGNTFDWNENTKKEGSETGVIAQEVEALGLPGISTTRDDGYMAVRYEKLVPLLIEAIKELKNEVDELKKGK